MKIAVIGAGVQGRAFALACARAGFAVVLEDVMDHKLRRAADEFGSLGSAVRLVATVEDAVSDADVVVDFVPDELESKLEIWSLIDRMAPPRTVMCTPSDALSITDLASCMYRGDRCVMIRGELAPGSPVRILMAKATSTATVDCVVEMLDGLGCVCVAEADPDLPMLLKNMGATELC